MKVHVQAEVKLNDKHLGLVQNLDEKDRGPFLFWLLNEATSVQRQWFAALLEGLHTKSSSGTEISHFSVCMSTYVMFPGVNVDMLIWGCTAATFQAI